MSYKNTLINELSQCIERSNFLFIADYKEVNSTEFLELRTQLSEKGAQCKVSKNTFVKHIVKDKKLPEKLNEYLNGQNVFVTGDCEANDIAKALKDFHKKNKKGKVKAGLMDGSFLDPNSFEQLADLPGKEELQAKFLALLNTPATNLLRIMNEPSSSFARLLKAKADSQNEK